MSDPGSRLLIRSMRFRLALHLHTLLLLPQKCTGTVLLGVNCLRSSRCRRGVGFGRQAEEGTMSRKVFSRFVAALIVGLLAASTLSASIDRGSIQGTVTDQQGATVPGAKVVVKNVNTNVEVNLSTNSAGFYLAAELVPGKYSVRVSAQGFSPLDINGLVVTAGTVTMARSEE